MVGEVWGPPLHPRSTLIYTIIIFLEFRTTTMYYPDGVTDMTEDEDRKIEPAPRTPPAGAPDSDIVWEDPDVSAALGRCRPRM